LVDPFNIVPAEVDPQIKAELSSGTVTGPDLPAAGAKPPLVAGGVALPGVGVLPAGGLGSLKSALRKTAPGGVSAGGGGTNGTETAPTPAVSEDLNFTQSSKHAICIHVYGVHHIQAGEAEASEPQKPAWMTKLKTRQSNPQEAIEPKETATPPEQSTAPAWMAKLKSRASNIEPQGAATKPAPAAAAAAAAVQPLVSPRSTPAQISPLAQPGGATPSVVSPRGQPAIPPVTATAPQGNSLLSLLSHS